MKPVHRQLLALLLAVVLGSRPVPEPVCLGQQIYPPRRPAYGRPADPDG